MILENIAAQPREPFSLECAGGHRALQLFLGHAPLASLGGFSHEPIDAFVRFHTQLSGSRVLTNHHAGNTGVIEKPFCRG